MDISIVDHSPKFKPSILELFKNTFDRKLSQEFWNWRFENNPFGKPIIKNAIYNSEIIAHYLLHPVELSYGKDRISSLFSMMTMTNPQFSGRGIMTELANQVYQLGKNLGYDLVFGFANNISRKMFTQNLGFNELNTMNEISCNISNLPKLNSQYKCHEITTFDNSITELYNKCNMDNHIIIPRTKNYLNWRFIQHPEVSYQCYNVLKDDDIVGYFVLKKFNDVKTHIVDFLTSADDPTIFEAIINESKKFSEKNKLPKITLWGNPNLAFLKYLESIGFSKQPITSYFCIKPLSSKINTKIFYNFHNWYITMSDSDVF